MLSIFPWPFYIKKTKQNILRKIEMASLLKWVSWELAVLWNFFPLPTSAHFWREFPSAALWMQFPKHWFYSCSYGEWQRGRGFLPAHLWLLWQGEMRKVLGYRWKQYVYQHVYPGLPVCTISTPLPFIQGKSKPLQMCCGERAVIYRQDNSRVRLEGGNPSPRRTWRPGDSSKGPATQRLHHPLGALGLALMSDNHCLDLGTVVPWRGPGTMSLRQVPSWHIMPAPSALGQSSLKTQPSWARGVYPSCGHSGMRNEVGILPIYIFQFTFYFCWNTVDKQCCVYFGE